MVGEYRILNKRLSVLKKETFRQTFDIISWLVKNLLNIRVSNISLVVVRRVHKIVVNVLLDFARQKIASAVFRYRFEILLLLTVQRRLKFSLAF